jgi:hypothetical protein
VAAQAKVEATPFLNSVPPPSWRAQRPKFDAEKARSTLPPDHPAEIRELDTFALPETVTGTEADRMFTCDQMQITNSNNH